MTKQKHWLPVLTSLLSRDERWRLAVLAVLLIVTAFFQAFGVASVLPFIALLSTPEVIETNRYLAWAYNALGFTDRQDFIIAVGGLFLALLLTSLGLLAVSQRLSLRFSQNRGRLWSTRLLENYLNKPYSWHLGRNSATLITAVTNEVREIVNGVLFPALQIMVQSITVAGLAAVLLVTDPLLAIGSCIFLGGGFWSIQVAVRQRLKTLGEEWRIAMATRLQASQEAFGGIKDIKVLGLESIIPKRFAGAALSYARINTAMQSIQILPPLGMQALLFGGLLAALLYLIAAYGTFASAVPILALFAFAGYRLMPALQHIYANVVSITTYQAPLFALADDLRLSDSGSTQRAEAPPVLAHTLELDRVSYRYPNAEYDALTDVSISIPANQTVALVGPSGSGKSTTADVLLGLLEPTAGALKLDGNPLTPPLINAWRRRLGYVPQQIFLTDGTVAQNIAFALPDVDIDNAAVERAARLANLHDFVMNELPNGYATMVGERGVRLSGGQRQRIGIARALYYNPELLVMDEATSALDNLTEQAVMEAVKALAHKKTIVLIAHRLSTVRNCDCIFVLEGGRLTGQGTFDELVASHSSFRALARAGEK